MSENSILMLAAIIGIVVLLIVIGGIDQYFKSKERFVERLHSRMKGSYDAKD